MKKYLVSFLCLTGVVFVGYAHKEIALKAADYTDFPPPVKRTPPVVPTVDYEGEVFTVNTPFVVECVPFTICDEDGAARIVPYIAR